MDIGRIAGSNSTLFFRKKRVQYPKETVYKKGMK